jgi:lipopolysaccharide transport protein LptA
VKFFCFIAFFALANVRELPAQTNAPATPRATTRIDSDSVDFDMNTNARTATYLGHVRVDDPQMKLTCVWLLADLPQGGGHINHIVAETNVVIDFADDKGQTNHATSDKAVYDYNVQGTVTNETVTLTGRAQVENVQEMLKGEPIVWDRANNHFSAVNETMVFRQNLDNEIIRTNSTAANTNKLSVPK